MSFSVYRCLVLLVIVTSFRLRNSSKRNLFLLLTPYILLFPFFVPPFIEPVADSTLLLSFVPSRLQKERALQLAAESSQQRAPTGEMAEQQPTQQQQSSDQQHRPSTGSLYRLDKASSVVVAASLSSSAPPAPTTPASQATTTVAAAAAAVQAAATPATL